MFPNVVIPSGSSKLEAIRLWMEIIIDQMQRIEFGQQERETQVQDKHKKIIEALQMWCKQGITI